MTGAPTIAFRRHLAQRAVPGEGVYLVSERGVSVVGGALAAELAPLLDGTRTADEIVAELPSSPPERVLYGIETLVRGGWACTAPAAAGPEAAYWEMAGVEAGVATERLAAQAVRVVTLGDDLDDHAGAVALGCRAAGLDVRGGGAHRPGQGAGAGELLLVLVEDYLDPDLAIVNREALAGKSNWLIAKPSGSVIWVGPLFRPGGSGCWSCLANRLAANRQAGTYLEGRLGSQNVRPPRAELPVTVQLAGSVIGLEVATQLAGAATGDAAFVRTIDTPAFAVTEHELVRRPQCPDCGDPGLQAELGNSPVRFASRLKAVTADGGHRAARPEELVERFARQVSPVTGVVTGLHKMEAGPVGLHLFTAGQNLARQVSDLRALRRGLRSLSCGKGMSDVQARASAIGESIERYSGVFQGDEARVRARLGELGDEAVHPADCLLFSEHQYAERDRLNRSGSSFNVVYDPFREDDEIEWSPVWSLTEERFRYLATSSLYYGYPHEPGRTFAVADSNGNAAGTSLEDAALQGFFELVERDAVALWWYNRVRRPAVDLGSFGEPYIEALVETYAGLGREVWALDLTSDLGVPAVGAVSRRVDHPTEDILVAFGAHYDPKIALLRALTEMNQFLPAVLPAGTRGAGRYAAHDEEMVRWWTTATLENQPYLVPDPLAAPRRPSGWPQVVNDDLVADLELARAIVEAQGLQMLVLDQTRPDIGLPVVKVVVPGLRHFWARFAPGRLYDVPVRLGWLDAPTAEADLNPVPVFI